MIVVGLLGASLTASLSMVSAHEDDGFMGQSGLMRGMMDACTSAMGGMMDQMEGR